MLKYLNKRENNGGIIVKRNRGVDIFRAIALFFVLLFHAWDVCGKVTINNKIISMLMSLAGEIGVTSFFVLSGFGVYNSLKNMDEKNTLTFKNHITKRLLRVVPQYYLNLMVIVFYGGSIAYFSRIGLPHLISHGLFIHNLFPGHLISINGVLWTMGNIVQFYFIAYFLYKIMKKNPTVFWISSVIFTVVVKFVMYAFVAPAAFPDGSQMFFLGRQLLPALDNFTTGMFAAYLVGTMKEKTNSLRNGSLTIFGGIVILLGVCQFGIDNGIHSNDLSGYTWHSLLAISLCIIMFGFSLLSVSERNPITKVLLWLSDVEYGVYLWHLPLFFNLVGGPGVVAGLLEKGYVWLTIIVIIVISIFVGAIFTKMTDALVRECVIKINTKHNEK